MEIAMTIEKKLENTKLTVFISGKLNTITSPQLDAELGSLDGITELVLDLEKLEQITSAGLRVLLNAQCIMEEKGTMVVTHVNEAIREIFELTGFISFLVIE